MNIIAFSKEGLAAHGEPHLEETTFEHIVTLAGAGGLATTDLMGREDFETPSIPVALDADLVPELTKPYPVFDVSGDGRVYLGAIDAYHEKSEGDAVETAPVEAATEPSDEPATAPAESDTVFDGGEPPVSDTSDVN